tara:strand:+ start:145 stop:615 length:471 start_codon:yes stop_codon:yes gene_type:complete
MSSSITPTTAKQGKLEKELEELKKQIQVALTQLKETCDKLSLPYESLCFENDEINRKWAEDNTRHTDIIGELEEEVKELKERLEKSEAEKEDLETELEEKVDEVDELNEKVEELEEQVYERDSLKKERDSLKKYHDEMEKVITTFADNADAISNAD